MSFSGLSLEDSPAWGIVSPPASDLIKDALRKEQLLKYALGFSAVSFPTLTCNLTGISQRPRTIFVVRSFTFPAFSMILIPITSALVSRVQSVQKEVDKLEGGNQTLQMYIDNLTVQMAKRR
jgi:hypothetical protein